MLRTSKLVLAALLVSGLFVAPTNAQDKTPTMGPFTLTHTCPTTPVISQGRTGTCWSFATVSYFETEAARASGTLVDLSEIYPVRHCYIQKMERYVKAKGENTLGEGGLSHDLISVIADHGLIPQSAYSGLLPDARGHSHGEMFNVMKATADAFAKGERPPSKNWTAALSGIMDAYIGAVPETFTVDGKSYTPKEYTKEVLKLEPKKYIEVMSYGYSEFDKPAKLTVDDNWMHYDQYKNVRIEEFMRGINHALETGYSVALDCDVSEPGFVAPKGIAQLPADLEKPGAVTQGHGPRVAVSAV